VKANNQRRAQSATKDSEVTKPLSQMVLPCTVKTELLKEFIFQLILECILEEIPKLELFWVLKRTGANMD
jgi:hypothetical protein